MSERDRGFWLSGFAGMCSIVAGLIEHHWWMAAFLAFACLFIGNTSKGLPA